MSDPNSSPQTTDPPMSPKHGPITRLVRAALAAGSWTWAASAWGLLAWWLLGRGLSDRFTWSQWALWTPTELIIALMGALIAIVWGFRKLAGSGPIRGRSLRIVWAAVLGWLIFVPWRAWVPAGRALFGTPASSINVMFWNANSVSGPTLHKVLPDRPLDLLIIVNALPRVDWTLVSQQIGDGATAKGLGRANIITNHQILRWGSASLGLEGRIQGTRQAGRWTDPGWAGFFEIDTADELGQTTVVWVIDLPSDPEIPRAAMTRAAADAIHDWVGPALAMIEGTPTVEPLDTPGFPEPDIIIGDFNIPRGSWSLHALTDPLSNAWSDGWLGFGLGGGVGPLGSWPRTKPVYHIDQTFLAQDLRSCSYELLDLGVGTHRAQVVGIAKRK